MANMTITEAEAQLLTVNAAIQQLIDGKRLTQLEIGSGSFKRVYKNQEINLSDLLTLRNELRNIISALQPTVQPIFRTNCSIPLLVDKGNY
jgi:hypothetical protein